MKFIQLTPGTGGMYCGNCFRDNALVTALRAMGHEALMVPLYLPLTLDEADASRETPVFFGGISVYLEQKFPLFRWAPDWLRQLLASRRLLAQAAGHSAKTRAEDVGDILISMLRGPDGRQARELESLIAWLKAGTVPDAICLSNALLLGMAGPLKRALGTRLICFLQGEDSYVDSLIERFRNPAWQLLREKGADVDLFIAPNRFYAGVMTERLGLDPGKVRVVPDGIHLDDAWERRPAAGGAGDEAASVPTLGYFARMCSEKGLGLLVEAFMELRRRGTVPGLKLKVGGGCGPSDESYVAGLKQALARAGLAAAVSWHPNVDRDHKIDLLKSLTVFSVPATYPEAFGLYLAEALAAGVPVVQPRRASFPEFIEATGGGVLYEADNPGALVEALEGLLLNPDKARALGETGRRAVHEHFSARRMAENFCDAVSTEH